MEGTSFLPSTMRAFGLIARNLARVAMVTVVGSVAVAIGIYFSIYYLVLF